VGVALAAHLVEAAGLGEFSNYTRAHVFEPLGLQATAWTLAELPAGADVAVPYAHADDSSRAAALASAMADNPWLASAGQVQYAAAAPPPPQQRADGGYVSFGLYGKADWPSASLRTSAPQLAAHLSAFMQLGALPDGERQTDRQTDRQTVRQRAAACLKPEA
jgi:CubicO group peptidase (beta-lactamase class C family)